MNAVTVGVYNTHVSVETCHRAWNSASLCLYVFDLLLF